MTKQTRWKQRMREAGRCVICGRERGKWSTALCLTHLRQQRARVRKRLGYHAWRPGGPGCPPLEGSVHGLVEEEENDG